MNSSVFVNMALNDYNLTLNGGLNLISNSGDIEIIDNNYKSGTTLNAGGCGYNYAVIDETDTTLSYKCTNTITDIIYTVDDVIDINSEDILLFNLINKNRKICVYWKIVNTEDSSNVITMLGSNVITQILSNIKNDGNYLSDAIYNVSINSI